MGDMSSRHVASEVPATLSDDEGIVDIAQIDHYKSNIFLWTLYDLGNTLYSLGVVGLVMLPLINIVSIAGAAGIDPTTLILKPASVTQQQFQSGASFASFIYFFFIAIGNIVVIVLSPIIGAFADQLKTRKYLLLGLSSLSILSTGLITTFLSLPWLITWYFLANIFFSLALVIYESMIPFIAKPDHTSKVSAIGIAIGYVGSFIAILVSEGFKSSLPDYRLNEQVYRIQIGYIQEYVPIIAVLFAVFSIPIFFIQEGRDIPGETEFELRGILTNTYERLKGTLLEMTDVADSRNFLIGWLLFVDIANVATIYMSVIITLGLGLDPSIVNTVLGIGIASAIIFTYPIGILGDRIGPHRLVKLVASLWMVSFVLALFTNLEIGSYTTPEWFIYVMAVILGPGLGGTFVIPRQMVAEIAPEDKMSNYYALANIFARISTIIGPAIVFIVLNIGTSIGITVSSSYRIIMICIAVVMLLGTKFLGKITDRHDLYLQGYRHVGDGEWKKIK